MEEGGREWRPVTGTIAARRRRTVMQTVALIASLRVVATLSFPQDARLVVTVIDDFERPIQGASVGVTRGDDSEDDVSPATRVATDGTGTAIIRVASFRTFRIVAVLD